jgi:hypothetical protein
MKKTILSISALLMLFALSFAQPIQRNKAETATKEWRYELECVGVGTQGSYLVKVWSYSKNAKVAIEQAKKNAVHGIVFKGYAGSGQKCPSQRALVTQVGAEDQFEPFFSKFFADGGDYMKYISVSGDGAPGAGDVVKVGKEYKIGIVVSVMKDALRKDLEAAGVVRGLSSGF